MSRRVETGTETQMLGVNAEGEDYAGRLIKYIPSEVIGAYIALAALVPATYVNRQDALWLIFGACAIAVPIYLVPMTWKLGKGPLIIQVILGTLAFPVWVFAIGGPFAKLAWYEGWIASAVLIFVTLIFGAIPPKKGA